MIITPSHRISSRFENNLNNVVNNDAFSGQGTWSYGDGNFGRRVNLTNANSRIDLGMNYIGNLVDGAAAVTVAFEVELISFNTRSALISTFSAINPPSSFNAAAMIYAEEYQSGDLRIFARSRGNETIRSLTVADVFTAGVPCYLCIVFDYQNNSIIAYKDGSQIGINSSVGFVSSVYDHRGDNTQHEDWLGNHSADTSRKASCYLDELNVFAKRLNDSDIRRIALGLHPLNG